MFLRARGSCAFHVLGRMEVDEPKRKVAKRRAIATSTGSSSTKGGVSEKKIDLTDTGWALNQPRSSVENKQAAMTHGFTSDEVADIEVLLPNGEELEYPSDASSEGFIRWMQSKSN